MSRRTLRVAEAIREVVARAILFDLKDPRITGVTVTGVEVTGDLRHAKIRVSLMGTDAAQQLALYGLKSARGFLQKIVADRLETRFTPVLEFVVDESVKKSIELSRLLKEVLPATTATLDSEEDPAPSDLDESDDED